MIWVHKIQYLVFNFKNSNEVIITNFTLTISPFIPGTPGTPGKPFSPSIPGVPLNPGVPGSP